MVKQKQKSYEAPITEVLELNIEGVICGSNPMMLMLFSSFGSDNAAGAELIVDDGYNFD